MVSPLCVLSPAMVAVHYAAGLGAGRKPADVARTRYGQARIIPSWLGRGAMIFHIGRPAEVSSCLRFHTDPNRCPDVPCHSSGSASLLAVVGDSFLTRYSSQPRSRYARRTARRMQAFLPSSSKTGRRLGNIKSPGAAATELVFSFPFVSAII